MKNIAHEFEVGIEVEKEHTQDRALASKIASDHLREDPTYYTKLLAAGLVNEPVPQALAHLDRGATGTGELPVKVEKNNSIQFGKTPPKLPAPTTVNAEGGLVNQTTGAKMTNQVALDKGTIPLKQNDTMPLKPTPKMKGAEMLVVVADPEDSFLGQIHEISL
jgi:hypothetical protein